MLLPTGKVPPALLGELFGRLRPGPDVVLGPGIGRDAAVLRLGDRLLVAKSDPITFATDRIGAYVVHVNANDLAAMGAVPRWFLATVLFPEGTTDALVREVFEQITTTCGSLGIELVGGHSEITGGLDRVLVAGTLLGEPGPHGVLGATGAQPGDELILTKSLAIEGTAVIARERGDRLLAAGLFPETVEQMRGLLVEPGISVVRDAAVALASGTVHALHDPTEGGFAAALHELAVASGVAIEVDEAAIPVNDHTLLLCRALELDPLALLASGSLLIAAPSPASQQVVDALGAAGLAAAIVGHCLAGEPAVRLVLADGEVIDLPLPERDEVARWFDEG